MVTLTTVGVVGGAFLAGCAVPVVVSLLVRLCIPRLHTRPSGPVFLVGIAYGAVALGIALLVLLVPILIRRPLLPFLGAAYCRGIAGMRAFLGRY